MECVQRQLVSDVPLGAFLSGGVDSSLVVNSMDHANTFSIGFDDPTYNELEWARKVAHHLGAHHVDDIIKLDKGPEELITINVDHVPKFMGYPGVIKGNRAVEITTLITKNGGRR